VYSALLAGLVWLSNDPRPDLAPASVGGSLAALLLVPVFWRSTLLPALTVMALIAGLLRWARPFGLPNEILDGAVVIAAIVAFILVLFSFLSARSPQRMQ
jgi:hypothetical protein